MFSAKSVMNIATFLLASGLLGVVYLLGALLRIKTRHIFLLSMALIALVVCIGTYRGRAGRADIGSIGRSYGPTFGMPHTSGAIGRETMKWFMAAALLIETTLFSFLYKSRFYRKTDPTTAPRAVLGMRVRKPTLIWVTLVLALSACYVWVFVFDRITRLHLAAESGNLDTIRRLVAHSPERVESKHFRKTPLWRAASNGQALAAVLLVELGADVNARCSVLGSDSFADPLSQAASRGHIETVRALLEHGASVSPASNLGYTPLHWAVARDNVEFVKLLLEFEADVNAVYRPGNGVVFSSLSHAKSHDMVALLIDHGASLETGDDSVLPKAAIRGDLESVRRFVRLGVNVNGRDARAMTALHYAARGGHAEIAKFLLAHGANPDARGGSDVFRSPMNRRPEPPLGQTPLHYAGYFSHADVVAVLVGAGCAINPFDSQGHTPTYWSNPQRSRGHAQARKTYDYLREHGGVTDTREQP